jgi:alanine dehydrogenase
MRIGVPAETKPGERRVALVPRDIALLSGDGDDVSVEGGAGLGTGFSDDDYRRAGARVVNADSAWDGEMIVKVKELQESDFARAVPGQVIFGYHRLVGHPDHARRLLKSGVTAIAYKAVRDANGGFPLLAPMSIIAGRMAVQVAARALGHAPANVLVLGAGCAGNSAADAARAAGARVTQLRRATATAQAVKDAALQADLVVGAAFTAGQRSPKLLPRSLVAQMTRGSMIVDISIEEGGVAETSRATSHTDPTYVEEGVLHYAVPNMPSAVPREAAEAISAAVIPYARALASKGIARALLEDAGLRAGVLVWKGRCNHEGVAQESGAPYAPVSDLELQRCWSGSRSDR